MPRRASSQPAAQRLTGGAADTARLVPDYVSAIWLAGRAAGLAPMLD